MKTSARNSLLGIASLAAGLLLTGSASAWWYGDPWYRPYGSGAVTYERQSMMRGHGYAMKDLADMFAGRRLFDRDEAATLARELGEGFGDNLLRNFAPGTVVAGSRTAPSTWRHFGAFSAYARSAEQSSARLAELLEQDTADQQRAARMPPRGMGYGPRGRWSDERIPVEAMQEFGRLNATCYSCHALFRGPRR